MNCQNCPRSRWRRTKSGTLSRMSARSNSSRRRRWYVGSLPSNWPPVENARRLSCKRRTFSSNVRSSASSNMLPDLRWRMEGCASPLLAALLGCGLYPIADLVAAVVIHPVVRRIYLRQVGADPFLFALRSWKIIEELGCGINAGQGATKSRSRYTRSQPFTPVQRPYHRARYGLAPRGFRCPYNEARRLRSGGRRTPLGSFARC